MIRYLYADQLAAAPLLREGMFRDRADQFAGRLNWDVLVDENGFETDAYDKENPLYVIWQQADGGHGGSMRFLPTTGPVMVNDHFGHLTGGVTITSPLIWEVTRFCISPNAEKSTRISAQLMLAGAELGRRFHLAHAVGVFDARMIRIYKLLGWDQMFWVPKERALMQSLSASGISLQRHSPCFCRKRASLSSNRPIGLTSPSGVATQCTSRPDLSGNPGHTKLSL